MTDRYTSAQRARQLAVDMSRPVLTLLSATDQIAEERPAVAASARIQARALVADVRELLERLEVELNAEALAADDLVHGGRP